MLKRRTVLGGTAGWTIVAGSDCGNPCTFPGTALINELSLLKTAGLTDAEALRAATIDAAKCCRLEQSHGTIEAGKIANIVLLKANPLEDVSRTRQVDRVILRGKSLDESKLLAISPIP
jgi:imidazolonepropionase-like amidohydrolase